MRALAGGCVAVPSTLVDDDVAGPSRAAAANNMTQSCQRFSICVQFRKAAPQ